MSFCINCNIAIHANRPYYYYATDMDQELISIIEEWIVSEIENGNQLCPECFDLLINEVNIRNGGNIGQRRFGHEAVCICCGISLSRRSGRQPRPLHSDSAEHAYIELSIWPRHVLKYDLNSYEETLIIPKSVFKVVGIRLTREDSKFKRLTWNILYWVGFVNVFMAACLEVTNMIQTATEGSLIDLFRMMPCVGYLVLAMAKSFNIVYNRPVFENLVNELRDMWPQREVTQQEHDILSKALKQLRFVSKGYYWCNVVLNTVFICPPYIEIVKRLAGKDVPLILAFFFWLPFDQFQRGYYEFILLLQTWHCFLTIWFMLAGDLLFCVILSHITTQLDLLAVRISSLFQVPVDKQLVGSYPLAEYTGDNCELNEEFIDMNVREALHHAEMVKIITRHQSLIRLSRDVEDMFSFSLLLNFLNSSIIICFCGFCCVFVEKWNEMEYKIFLTTATTQIWLLCWYGQRLIDASKGISEALYNSGWYTSSQKIKRCIFIMTHRSQSEVYVSTYGFSVVSLESFSTIMKTSWSYFTLLINIYK